MVFRIQMGKTYLVSSISDTVHWPASTVMVRDYRPFWEIVLIAGIDLLQLLVDLLL